MTATFQAFEKSLTDTVLRLTATFQVFKKSFTDTTLRLTVPKKYRDPQELQAATDNFRQRLANAEQLADPSRQLAANLKIGEDLKKRREDLDHAQSLMQYLVLFATATALMAPAMLLTALFVKLAVVTVATSTSIPFGILQCTGIAWGARRVELAMGRVLKHKLFNHYEDVDAASAGADLTVEQLSEALSPQKAAAVKPAGTSAMSPGAQAHPAEAFNAVQQGKPASAGKPAPARAHTQVLSL